MEPLLDLALLLFGAKLGGILFSKLKQPSVVGELVAGIILGPSLLAIVSPSNLVTVVSDLGLLFLILLVSLSIDWKILEGKTERYVWVELGRMAITLCLVYIVLSFFHFGSTGSMGNIYLFLVLGFITVLSSTAIVSRTLADMNDLNSNEGQTLMGLEVVDEVVAIVSVALLANMLNGGTFAIDPIITTIFVVVGFFVVMSRVGFKLVNRLTSSIQKYGIEEALLGFTLLLAFLLGSVTESLNLAAVLGVFIAGMILSRSAQFPVITRKVKEIGESFFIPIFFASVGLTINIFLAFQNGWLLLSLIGGIVGIKIASTFIIMKFFRYKSGQAIKVASGFVTLSEMTVVIAALAVTTLDPAMYAAIIASFVIINTVSPLIMSVAFGNKVRLRFNFLDNVPRVGSKYRKWKMDHHNQKYTYRKKDEKEK